MNDPASTAKNPYQPPVFREADDGPTAPAVVSPEQLTWTGYGLWTLSVGILLFVLAILVATVAVLWPPLVLVGAGLVIIAGLMGVAGHLMCLTVPSATGARTLVILSVAMFAFAFAAGLLGPVFPQQPMLVWLTLFCSLIGTLLFVLFLRRLARLLHRADLRRKADRVCYGIGALLVAALAISGLTLAGAVVGHLKSMSIPVMFGALVIFVMHANLVDELGKAITELRRDASRSCPRR